MAEEPTTVVTPVTSTAASQDPTKPSDGTQTTEPQKADITFTPEQQKALDEAIARRIGKVKERAQEETGAMKKQLDDSLAQLTQYREKEDATRKEIEDKEREKALQKGEYEKVLGMEKARYEAELKKAKEEQAAKEAHIERLRSDLFATKVDNALLAILDTEAVDPDAAVALIKRDYQITFNEATGSVAVNGDPDLSLSKVVQEFLAKRSYLAKGQFVGKAGGGTTPAKGAPPAPTTFSKEQLADSAHYKEHRAEILEQMKQGKIHT